MYENLRLEKYESITENKVLLSGEDIVKGQAVSTVNANGKVVAFDSTASATETFYGIAAEDAVATGGDGNIIVYVKGVFNEDEIVFEDASTDDVDDIRADARSGGIYFKKTL